MNTLKTIQKKSYRDQNTLMVFISMYYGDKSFLKAFSENVLEHWYSYTEMILLSKNFLSMNIRPDKNKTT